MKRRVSAVEARKRLGELLESVYHRGDEVVIERAGKPMAVVIPAERYASMERSRRELFEMIEQNWARNRDVPPEEIERDIEIAVREVREERRQQLLEQIKHAQQRNRGVPLEDVEPDIEEAIREVRADRRRRGK